ncbi:MAG: hypothetical protein EAY75_14190, partial [Bacteroidetes bacterium]
QEAWRSVNAMFEDKERKYLKALAENAAALAEKDSVLAQKDSVLAEKDRLIAELMQKLGQQ